ncbi:UNVERIFIED_CONTAM: hypothetical protein Sradi_3172600, partial [Sesamum radiatum]
MEFSCPTVYGKLMLNPITCVWWDSSRLINHFISRRYALPSKSCSYLLKEWRLSSSRRVVFYYDSNMELENPMQVVLEECDFFVQIHDLPLSMMNLGVATLIGNRIGVFPDMETDDSGCSWGASCVS